MFKCSENVHFCSFCTSLYASQLWCNFRKSCMQRLRVGCNFRCRALCNLPWTASVSSHQVQCNIPTFEALLRKNVYLFFERRRKSNNIWLHGLMQSDYLYSSLFVNTTIAFYFVTERPNIVVFVWWMVCHATTHLYFTWSRPVQGLAPYSALALYQCHILAGKC